ncbi:hypothetical protein [Rathayibacter sp. AY2B9]|uniref:hypothetical protein n=1 Tax=Rathayibacter sp. AY2B9 TaxID=2080572 RepID=UPI0015E3983D|nr:hypothetical protein [Rathayibacter sp. AY2B9]
MHEYETTYRAGRIHREQPEPVDLDDTAYIEHLIDTSPDRELARYAAAMQEHLSAPPAP